jgi:hypothetical protein
MFFRSFATVGDVVMFWNHLPVGDEYFWITFWGM